VLAALGAMVALGVPLLLTGSETWFWILALSLGLFFGPAQAASRSFMARLAPPGEASAWFGLFALSGRVTGFLGPAVLAAVTALTASQRLGMGTVLGCRAIFGALILATVISLLMTRFLLQETLAPADRQPVSVRALLRGSAKLLTHRGFMALTLLGGFAMGSFFVFIASATFVYTETFGLSPTGFSLAFAVNAIGFFAASQAAGPLGLRLGAKRVMVWATFGFFAFTAALFALALMGLATLSVCIAGLFLANACLGLIIPTTMVMALDEHGDIAGLASSLGGTLQMLAGGLMIAASGPFFDGTATPMLGAIAICGVLALVLSRLALAPRKRQAGNAA